MNIGAAVYGSPQWLPLHILNVESAQFPSVLFLKVSTR